MDDVYGPIALLDFVFIVLPLQTDAAATCRLCDDSGIRLSDRAGRVFATAASSRRTAATAAGVAGGVAFAFTGFARATVALIIRI